MNNDRKKELMQIATKVRMGAVEAVYSGKSGHPGGSLSCADVLTYLYFEKMNVDPKAPKADNRDRFVLSKGHCAPALYSVLAHKGFFSMDLLKTLRMSDSILQGHPDMKKIPGVDMSTGSLGQGISAAVGMALSGKHFNNPYRVYSILGDGECEEGQVWEAAMFASHKKLDNLCIVVDFNGLQIDGAVTDVNSPLPLDEKFAAFGWNVIVINGNDMDEIDNAFTAAENCSGKPTAIIAKTTKGKGVSFMENQAGWHGKAPNQEEYTKAMEELTAYYNAL